MPVIYFIEIEVDKVAFSNEQLQRYSRHIILKDIGIQGQKKLLSSKNISFTLDNTIVILLQFFDCLCVAKTDL